MSLFSSEGAQYVEQPQSDESGLTWAKRALLSGCEDITAVRILSDEVAT